MILQEGLIDHRIESIESRIGFFNMDDDGVLIERFAQSEGFHPIINGDDTSLYSQRFEVGKSLFDGDRFIVQSRYDLTLTEVAPLGFQPEAIRNQLRSERMILIGIFLFKLFDMVSLSMVFSPLQKDQIL